MIDPATIQRIMDAAKIVEVVSDFVNLKRAGVNFKGLCPFHSDRTPSLTVSPAKGLYKCFSCGNGGGVVKFVMEHEQMNYTEALKWLAKKYHIEVQERELTEEEKKQNDDKESMMVVNEWAAQYFENILENDVDGRAIGLSYLRSRGFRDDIIHKFRLGYSPADRYALTKAAQKKGFEDSFLTQTGLCYTLNNGRLHDRFYGRVIFPFLSISGRVVGFGGRVLDSRTKGVDLKYVNSPESLVYDKSRNLYGLFQAKQSIVRQNFCLMVEGYTDVISLHQAGVENVVASSGTALTLGQIQLLHRFTTHVTLLYDSDEAGINASERGVDLLLQEGMSVKILQLPDGEDPDSYCRKHSAQEVQDYIQKNQEDFIRFRINRTLQAVSNDPLRKAELIKSIVKSIALIPDEITRSVYIKESAYSLNVAEGILLKSITQARKKNLEDRKKYKDGPRDVPPAEPSAPDTASLPNEMPSEAVIPPYTPGPVAIRPHERNVQEETESLIMRELVLYGEKIASEGMDDNGQNLSIHVADYIALCLAEDGISFSTPIYNKVLEDVRQQLRQNPDLKVQAYLTAHPDPAYANLAAELATDRYTISKLYAIEEKSNEELRLAHLINDLKLHLIDKQLKDTQKKLLDPSVRNDAEQLRQTLIQLQDLNRLKRELAKEAGDRVVTI